MEKDTYMNGYDNKTGSGEEVVVETDFYNFVKKVESIYQLNGVIAHSINFHNMTRASFSNGNNNSNSFGGFNRQNNTTTNTYEAPITSTSEFDSFIGSAAN
jgi:hypothetical protein